MNIVYTLLIALGAIAIYIVITQLIQRRYLKTLTEEEFKEGYRKAQLIDVREPDEFDRGHILGARNIPLTQMRTRKQEIRTDKPVYIYCQNSFRCARAASTLHKLGCKDINQLQGGFRKWGGRIKKKN